MKTRTATTVKVENELYYEFKVLGLKHKVTLQDLIEKCVYRYVKEEAFRNDTNAYSLPQPPVLSTNPPITIP